MLSDDSLPDLIIGDGQQDKDERNEPVEWVDFGHLEAGVEAGHLDEDYGQ